MARVQRANTLRAHSGAWLVYGLWFANVKPQAQCVTVLLATCVAFGIIFGLALSRYPHDVHDFCECTTLAPIV